MAKGRLFVESDYGELIQINRKRKNEDVYINTSSGEINIPVRTKYEMYLKIPEFDKGTYYKYFYILVKYLIPNTTVLGVPTRTNRKIFKFVDIMNILEASERTCRYFLKECRQKGYMLDLKDGGYSINPLYFRNGVKMGYLEFLFWTDNSQEYMKSLGADYEHILSILEECHIIDYEEVEKRIYKEQKNDD